MHQSATTQNYEILSYNFIEDDPKTLGLVCQQDFTKIPERISINFDGGWVSVQDTPH